MVTLRSLRGQVLLPGVLLSFAAVLGGCGGGTAMAAAPTGSPLRIDTTELSAVATDDHVEIEILLVGGCGGPYVLQIIDGQLPSGIDTDDDVIDLGGGNELFRHHLVGVVQVGGISTFTLAVTDIGCTPSVSASQVFSWSTSQIDAPDVVLPTATSSDDVEIEIPISGGCGGPYELRVMGGAMPGGVRLEDGTRELGGDLQEERHHIVGVPCQAGSFAFTIETTDLGCADLPSTTAQYEWNITEGPLRVVGAGDPDDPLLIHVADYDEPTKWPDIDALLPVEWGSLTAIPLIVCGGVAPYTMKVVDTGDTGGLPFGMNIAIGTTTLIGTPSSFGPDGRPFRIAFEVRDTAGHAIIRKLQWLITPKPD